MLKEIDHENDTQQAGFETISAHRMSDHSMKRTYFPGITDIVVGTLTRAVDHIFGVGYSFRFQAIRSK